VGLKRQSFKMSCIPPISQRQRELSDNSSQRGPGEKNWMKKSRYMEEQIVDTLKESEAGMETAELRRKHGVSQQTFIPGRRSTADWRVSRSR
jgi:hypothetical protein